MGIPFSVRIPDIPEFQRQGEPPRQFCKRISREKALSVAHEYPDSLIIGADTIVVVDGQILGKPKDDAQAYDFLALLQDRAHEVFTGYTIIFKTHARSRVVRTKVRFRPMSGEEITWYIASGEPRDKAGAYALQGIASLFIDSIQGSYTNVIGLPVSELYTDLKHFGLHCHRTA